MSTHSGRNLAYLFCFVVISVATVGFFVGLQSPMNPGATGQLGGQSLESGLVSIPHSAAPFNRTGETAVLATVYSEMRGVTERRHADRVTELSELVSSADPLAEVVITDAEKAFALARRDQNRAFNGAPPTVPHPIDQMSARACAACHTDGVKTKSLRIPKMSHQFLTNCTQCHVGTIVSADSDGSGLAAGNSFVGLPAPQGGPRAFALAPPQIPHSTWMRSDCTSCHGVMGANGLRTTHPWRQNCQQCHAPSSTLEQVQLDSQPQFLPPPAVKE